MKIAQVSAAFPPYMGGGGNVCYYNSVELAKRGHQITVFTADFGFGDYPYPSNINVTKLPIWFRFGFAPFTPGLIRINNYDLIHLHYPFIFGADLVRMTSTLRGIPFVLTHHNDLIGNKERKVLFHIYNLWVNKFVISHASKFIVVTKDYALNCQFSRYYKKRSSDVFFVPNGVDIDHFHPRVDGSLIRNKYQIPSDSKVILFVGALDRAHHYRRVDILMKAFSLCALENTYLMLVGEGDQVDHYKQIAFDLDGNAGRVVFVGKVNHLRLPAYYAAADVLVLPSSIQESFGMVLIEAMACGIPVITSNLPGVRTVVEDGVDGFLVEPGSAKYLAEKLSMMLSMPESQRRAMGAAGRSKVEQKFTWQAIGQCLEDIYQRVI